MDGASNGSSPSRLQSRYALMIYLENTKVALEDFATSMLVASTALVGFVTIAIYLCCTTRRRQTPDKTDGSKSRISVVPPFLETQTAVSVTMGNSQSDSAKPPEQEVAQEQSEAERGGDTGQQSSVDKPQSPLSAKTLHRSQRASSEGPSGHNKAALDTSKPPVSSKVLQQAKMFESGRVINQHYQYDAHKSVGDHKPSFKGHKIQDSHISSKTSLRGSNVLSDSTISNTICPTKSHQTTTLPSQSMSRNGSNRSSINSNIGIAKSQNTSQDAEVSRPSGRQRITSFDALVHDNELPDGVQSRESTQSVDTSIIDDTFAGLLAELARTSAPSSGAAGSVLLQHSAFKTMLASLHATLTCDRLQRQRAEDWADFLTLELEAHIDARIEAEERLVAARDRLRALQAECEQLRAGAHPTPPTPPSATDTTHAPLGGAAELPRCRMEVEEKFEHAHSRCEQEQSKRASRQVDTYLTALTAPLAHCEWPAQSTRETSQALGEADTRVFAPVVTEPEQPACGPATQVSPAQSTLETPQAQGEADTCAPSPVATGSEQPATERSVTMSPTAVHIPPEHNGARKHSSDPHQLNTQSDNDYSIALGAIASRSSVKWRNSSEWVTSQLGDTVSPPASSAQFEHTGTPPAPCTPSHPHHFSLSSSQTSDSSVDTFTATTPQTQCLESGAEIPSTQSDSNLSCSESEHTDNDETDSNHNKIRMKEELASDSEDMLTEELTVSDDVADANDVLKVTLDGVTTDESDLNADDIADTDGASQFNSISFEDKECFSFDDILKANLDYLSSDEDFDVDLNQSKGSDCAFSSENTNTVEVEPPGCSLSPRTGGALHKSHSDLMDAGPRAHGNRLSPRPAADGMTKSHSDMSVHDTARMWDDKLSRVARDKTSEQRAELDDMALENIQKTKLKWEEYSVANHSGGNSASASGTQSRRRSLEGEEECEEGSPSRLLQSKQLWEVGTRLQDASPCAPAQRRMSLEAGGAQPDVQQVKDKWETLFEERPQQEVARRNVRLVSKTAEELEADILSLDVNADSIANVSSTKSKWEHLMRDDDSGASKRRGAKRATLSKATDFGHLRGKFELRPTATDDTTDC